MMRVFNFRVLFSFFLSLFLLNQCQLGIDEKIDITSPDGKIELTFLIKNGIPFYEVNHSGRAVIKTSKLGFILKDYAPLNQNLHAVSNQQSSFDETWEQPWGEVKEVRNHYNELRIQLEFRLNLFVCYVHFGLQQFIERQNKLMVLSNELHSRSLSFHEFPHCFLTAELLHHLLDFFVDLIFSDRDALGRSSVENQQLHDAVIYHLPEARILLKVFQSNPVVIYSRYCVCVRCDRARADQKH